MDNLIDACDKSPTVHHHFLVSTADSVSTLTCLYCRIEASPMPPDPRDRWRPHD